MVSGEEREVITLEPGEFQLLDDQKALPLPEGGTTLDLPEVDEGEEEPTEEKKRLRKKLEELALALGIGASRIAALTTEQLAKDVREAGRRARAAGRIGTGGGRILGSAIGSAAKIQRQGLKERRPLLGRRELDPLGEEAPLEGPEVANVDLFSGGTQGFLDGLMGGSLGSGLGVAQAPTLVETTPMNLTVPGGLRIVAILKDSEGRVGYRVLWQGKQLDWFPQA